MNPFPRPIQAEWRPYEADPVVVHLLAVSEEEYLAVDAEGRTITDVHANFRIFDYDVKPWEGS